MAPPRPVNPVANRACTALAQAQGELAKAENQGIDVSELMMPPEPTVPVRLSEAETKQVQRKKLQELSEKAKKLIRLPPFRSFDLNLNLLLHKTKLSLGGRKLTLKEDSTVDVSPAFLTDNDGRPVFFVPAGDVRDKGVRTFLGPIPLPIHGVTRQSALLPVVLWKKLWGKPLEIEDQVRVLVPWQWLFFTFGTNVTDQLEDTDPGSLRSVLGRALKGIVPVDELIDAIFRLGQDSELTKTVKGRLNRVSLSAFSFPGNGNEIVLDVDYQQLKVLQDSEKLSLPKILSALDRILVGKDSHVIFRKFPVGDVAKILGIAKEAEGTVDLHFAYEQPKWVLKLENLSLKVVTGNSQSSVMIRGVLDVVWDPGRSEFSVAFKNVNMGVSNQKVDGPSGPLLVSAQFLLNGNALMSVEREQLFLKKADLEATEFAFNLRSTDAKKPLKISSGSSQGKLTLKYDAQDKTDNKIELALPVLEARSGARPTVKLNDVHLVVQSHPPAEIGVGANGRHKLHPQKLGPHPLSLQAKVRHGAYLLEGAFYLDSSLRDASCRIPMRGFAGVSNGKETRVQTWLHSQDVLTGFVGFYSGLAQSLFGYRAANGSFKGSVNLKAVSGSACVDQKYPAITNGGKVVAEGVSGCVTASMEEQQGDAHADAIPPAGLQNTSVAITRNDHGFTAEAKTDVMPRNLFFDLALKGAHLEASAKGTDLEHVEAFLKADAHASNMSNTAQGDVKTRVPLTGNLSSKGGQVSIRPTPEQTRALFAWQGRQFGFEGHLAGTYQVALKKDKTGITFEGDKLFKDGALYQINGDNVNVKLFNNLQIIRSRQENGTVFYQMKMTVFPALATLLLGDDAVFDFTFTSPYLPRDFSELLEMIRKKLKEQK